MQKDNDSDIRAMAEEEINSSSEELKILDLKLQKLLLPKDSKVTLRPTNKNTTIVSADGVSEIQLDIHDKLIIKSGRYPAKFLRSLSTISFYNTLANKLGLFNKT